MRRAGGQPRLLAGRDKGMRRASGSAHLPVEDGTPSRAISALPAYWCAS